MRQTESHVSSPPSTQPPPWKYTMSGPFGDAVCGLYKRTGISPCGPCITKSLTSPMVTKLPKVRACRRISARDSVIGLVSNVRPPSKRSTRKTICVDGCNLCPSTIIAAPPIARCTDCGSAQSNLTANFVRRSPIVTGISAGILLAVTPP